MKAICSNCLRPLAIAEEALQDALREAEARGRRASTIYASDALAFPGLGLPRLDGECDACGACVPIAVEDDVAADLPTVGEQR